MQHYITTHPLLLAFLTGSAVAFWLFIVFLIARSIWGDGNSLDENSEEDGEDFYGI